jgi:hypothetical protein
MIGGNSSLSITIARYDSIFGYSASEAVCAIVKDGSKILAEKEIL